MSTYNYARPLASANRLITRFGQAGYVRRPTTSGTSYNPTQGAPDDHPAKFAVTNYEDKEIDGSRILSSDKKVLLAPGTLTIEPTSTDLLIEADGSAYKVIAVKTLKPARTVLLYTIQARR